MGWKLHTEPITTEMRFGFSIHTPSDFGFLLVKVPIWIFVLLSSGLTMLTFRAAPRLPHQCRKCRYDLTGITTVCPECGTPIARTKKPADPKTDGR